MNDGKEPLEIVRRMAAIVERLQCLAEENAQTRFSAKRQTAATFHPPEPASRQLRGYAVDPSFATKLDSVDISEVTYQLPWEPLKPGPVGEYLEVIDVDPGSDAVYEPVNLDAPALLAQGGLPPSEGVPQFHQQMVYAVCSLTIHNFETALGRKVLWRPGPPPAGRHPKDDSHFVQRLRIYPHALREANAFYSPAKVALLFGYFKASADDPGDHLPGGQVYTCLSHDIVAHETTHAILDGMHRRFLLPSNRDVRAFHEAFADCVAMLQHFTFPELVAQQIANTRGEIQAHENLLVQLASQFGRATGQRTALRDAIGTVDEENGTWKLREPNPRDYQTAEEPHLRGEILLSAVFDAFLSIYKRRTADLQRLASGGTGVLRPGAIPPDLVKRLAHEARKTAEHVLGMCIRALDYCPPTDITFGEYLRAIITADYDLVPDDDLNYRISFIEAFRRRGIFPANTRTLSVQSLLWRSLESGDYKPSERLRDYLVDLRDKEQIHVYAKSRQELFENQRSMRARLHYWLSAHLKKPEFSQRDARFLGLYPNRPFEVHMLRYAYRTAPDGGVAPQLLISLLQETSHPIDPGEPNGAYMPFEGGCTLIVDLRKEEVRYCIRKSAANQSRLAEQQQLAMKNFASPSATYLNIQGLSENPSVSNDSCAFAREPFALIHRGV